MTMSNQNSNVSSRLTKSANATASLTLTRAAVDAIVLGQSDFDALIADGSIRLDGDAEAFADFVSLLDTFEFWFDIVTP